MHSNIFVLLQKAQDYIQDVMIHSKELGPDARILASSIIGQIAELELLIRQVQIRKNELPAIVD